VKRQTRSLLEELNDIAIKKDTEAVIESRAAHVIDSAVNLLRMIRENYDQESAYELERRFINSIKASDPAKFTRGIRKLRDNKETAKGLKLIEGDIKDDE
jgi:rRNA maturation endonuclease Nob1